jgi:hypothetical protein
LCQAWFLIFVSIQYLVPCHSEVGAAEGVLHVFELKLLLHTTRNYLQDLVVGFLQIWHKKAFPFSTHASEKQEGRSAYFLAHQSLVAGKYGPAAYGSLPVTQ